MSETGSDTSDDVDDVSPPWGSLPVENFLLVSQTRPWYCAGKSYSGHSTDLLSPVAKMGLRILRRRRRATEALLREYVKAGSQRASFHITQWVAEMDLGHHRQDGTVALPPTPAQIASVLRPWRTVEQRDLAVDPGQIGSVWLRTCYKEGTDAQHDALVAQIDMEMAVDRNERLLNDATLYDFGDSWERVLDYIPELICNQDEDASSRSECLQNAVDTFRKAQVILSNFSAAAEVNGPRKGLIVDARRHLPAADVQEYVLKILQSDIHEACVANYMIVEDQEALNTGLVLLLFLDDRGRVVRRYRLGASEAEQIGGGWLEMCWNESRYWVEADVGEDYREDGVCGDLLYFKPGA